MKKLLLLLMTISILNLTAQSCDGRYQTELFDSVNVATVDYGSAVNMAGVTQTLSMDIYTAREDTIATDRPVVIFCFGGSFIGGSRTSNELVAMATALAKRGYVCASIDYRLASSAIDLLQEEKMVKVVFGAVHDGKAAVRYFKKNVSEGNSLRIDSNQIAIGGTSAGGILAMNLAFLDDVSKLPTTWQTWLGEIGGVEGNSGNAGHCSIVNATFGFAGAVGDTSYIDENDVPFYACHATGDQTVLYNFGKPLNGLAPVKLYGSGLVVDRLNNLGIYNVIDTYSGSDHPPISATTFPTIFSNFSNFLYNTLDCNANNQKKAIQKDCSSQPIGSAIDRVDAYGSHLISAYPNPSSDMIYVASEFEMQEILLVDMLGKTIYQKQLAKQNTAEISVQDLAKSVYYLKVKLDNKWVSKIISVQ